MSGTNGARQVSSMIINDKVAQQVDFLGEYKKMKHQPFGVVDVPEAKYKNVSTNNLVDTLAQKQVKEKAHQSVAVQDSQTSLVISFENIINDLKRQEIVTRHQDKSIEQAKAILADNELFQTLIFRQDKLEAIVRFYALLIELASIYAHQHGQKRASFVSLLSATELLAACTGYSRQALLNKNGYMAILRDIGVIDYKGHVITTDSGNKYDGTLICVKMKVTEKTAKLTHMDWSHCVERDYKLVKSTKNTVYELKKQLKELCGQSLSLKENTYKLQVLVNHCLLKNSDLKNSVSNECPQNTDELINAVLDTPNVHYTNRFEYINNLALGICTVLNDKQSYRFWCSLLWKTHKYLVNAGIDHFKTIANVLMRAEIAVREGKQKGGAYAYELLKGFKLFQTFQDASI